jgi:molecular chaperone DnaJ
MAENFYEILGVSEDATTAAIEDAYREEIKRAHPDVSDDVDAGERTKRLNKAKQVLTNEDERARYDSVGHETYLGGEPASPAGSAGSRGGGAASGSTERGTGRASRRSSAGTTGTTNETVTGGESGSGTTWAGRSPSRSGQGRSVSSSGPTWQSARTRRTTGRAAGATGTAGGVTGNAAGATATGPSGQRQASAGSTDGADVARSWNAWEQTRSWAVRQGGTDRPGFDPNRLLPTEQSVLLLVSTFFLYPFFVASALYPLFPVVARLLVALCTLMMFAYLLSVPEVSVAVFGLWSVLAPLALVVLPGVGLFSLLGVVALSTTWVPFGLSVLTLSMMER